MKNSYTLEYLVEEKSGTLYYLGYVDEGKEVNFLGSPVDLPPVDNSGNGLCIPGYGSICLSYKSVGDEKAGVSKWIEFSATSDDVDKYTYEDGKIEVEKRYRLQNNRLEMEIKLSNLSVDVLEIDELSISVPVNDNYTELRYDQEYLYDNRVYEHIYPGGTCGYQLVQKLNGEPPFLFVTPTGSTSFEHTAHYPGSISFVREGIENNSWPGSSVIFIHSKGYMERNGYSGIMGKDCATSTKISPNREISYTIEIGFVDSYKEFEQKQINDGKIIVNAIPAMVTSIDNPVLLHVSSLYDVVFDGYENGCQIKQVKKVENGFVYRLEFAKPEQYFILVKNETGNFARLVFNIIPSLKELIEKRADFIVKNQVFNCKGDKLDGAILPYSMRTYTGSDGLVYEKGIFAKEESLWGNGSYEGGITEAMFLAEKNVLFPDRDQISALETYTLKYVRRYLQNPKTDEVIWWFIEYANTRAFDYMHLANFYYSMYFISKNYNLTREFQTKDYLSFAYKTLMKMYDASRHMDLVVGLMGGEGIFRILKAMQVENMIMEYYELDAKVQKHRRNLFVDNVPYGSECAYDNTGYECVMSFAEKFNDEFWLRKISDLIFAVRGIQPMWWWHGSDVRWWDADHDLSETCLHYTNPLNSGALIKAVLKNATTVDASRLSAIIGGILGTFSKIHSDGFASMSYSWEQESPNYGFHPFSGDVGLSLFGALQYLSSFVYCSQKLGTIGYLCEVIEEDKGNSIVILPRDGTGKRILWVVEKGVSETEESYTGRVELSTGSIKSMKVGSDFKTIDLEIAYDFNISHNTEISIKCPVSYNSALLIDGKRGRFTKTADGSIMIKYFVGEDSKSVKVCLAI